MPRRLSMRRREPGSPFARSRSSRSRDTVNRLAAIVSSSSDAIISKTLDGTITSWNNGAEELFGYRQEEMIGQSIRCIIPQDRQSEEERIIEQIAAGERVEEYETVRLHKHGRLIEVSVSVSPIRCDKGSIIGASKIARAITAQKQAEARIRESEARFRATFENAAVGMAQVGPDGSFLRVNQCFCVITGYSSDELLRKHFQDITHPDDLGPDIVQLKLALQGKIDSYSLEKRYLRKDGSIVWVKLTVGVTRKQDGPVDYLIAVAEDISERKRAHEELRDSEKFTRRVLDSIFTFVGVLDLDGRLIEVNRGPLEEAGILASDVIGKKFWDCFWWSYSSDVRDQIFDACQRAKKGEMIRYDAIARIINDGRMWIDFQLAPLRNEKGDITHLIPSATDLTPRRQAEAALRESEEWLRLANEAAGIGTFTIDLESGRALYSAQLSAILGFPGLDSATVEAALARVHRQDAQRVRQLYEAAITGVNAGHLKLDFRFVRPGGEVRWMTWIARVDFREETGLPFRVVGACLDITDRKRQEEQISLLMQEVNHRSKNMLSLVYAVARRTAASDPKEFIGRFGERIMALSASQDLLIENDWRGVDCHELVRSQLAHFNDLIGTRIKSHGPRFLISARAAQSLGMAVHELATNAGKYGALSGPAGYVDVAWTVERPQESQRIFSMSWTETGGPPVTAPSRSGFGSMVMSKLVQEGLRAEVELDYARTGLVWRMGCPVEEVCEPDPEASQAGDGEDGGGAL